MQERDYNWNPKRAFGNPECCIVPSFGQVIYLKSGFLSTKLPETVFNYIDFQICKPMPCATSH